MIRLPALPRALGVLLLGGWVVAQASAQDRSDDEAQALAIADRALAAISDEDLVALTDLMLEETVLYWAGERDGERRLGARSREEERALVLEVDIVERGFDPEVRVSGSVAMVWYPYDIYVDGAWLHCGVDIFNLVRTDAGWKIATIVWSADQPPLCRAHPDGPPEGATAPPAPG